MGKANIISVIVGVTVVGLVLGLSSYNDQAEAGMMPINGFNGFPPTEDPCNSLRGELIHWDKIIFKTDRKLINAFPSPGVLPILTPSKTYDIKVEQDPFSVTNLELTVSKFLNANFYTTVGEGKVTPAFITIVDVEYAIACTSSQLFI